METIHVDFDELTALVFKQSCSGPALHEMTPRTLSSGLRASILLSPTPWSPPTMNEWDTICYTTIVCMNTFNPPPIVDHPVLEFAASEPAVPNPVHPFLNLQADHDIEVVHMDSDPYVGLSLPEPSYKESSS
ncbi:hypothetical protein Tco_0015706 [Tanacetum coccineum]